MLASVETSLTATVGSATQLTAADVSVDAGNDVRVSGTAGSNAYMGTDNAHVSTAAELKAEVGTEVSVVGDSMKVEVVRGTTLSSDDVTVEAAGATTVRGAELLEVSAESVQLEAARDLSLIHI